ncbi:MAG: acyltransferase family protein [Betaproteobacteria bacterium]|nr:MAG: acyltransferase family protein [Betaproteobacteria bacterium]
MVIAHHAAQPYGPTGGAWPVADPVSSALLGPFFFVNASFGLGLLFLLAGYFTPQSYDRRGAAGFMRGRWLRIGVPMGVFIVLVQIPLVFLLAGRPALTELFRGLYAGGLLPVYMHLWFLGHVLLYSGVYALWRQISDRREKTASRNWPVPGHAAIVSFVIILALVTWLVRWRYPIDTWVPLFFVLAAEPAHLPQYVALFALGVIAFRGNWLRRISFRKGMIWLTIGLIAAAGAYAVMLVDLEMWRNLVATGGRNVRSLCLSALEAVICVGLSIGLIVLFRSLIQRASGLLAAMVMASYAAYVLHLLIVVAIQTAILGLELPALVKFALVTILAVPLAFGIGFCSRWVPGLRTLLGTAPKTREVRAVR